MVLLRMFCSDKEPSPNSTFDSKAVSVTRYGAVRGFLDESFKTFSVFGFSVVGFTDVVISV